MSDAVAMDPADQMLVQASARSSLQAVGRGRGDPGGPELASVDPVTLAGREPGPPATRTGGGGWGTHTGAIRPSGNRIAEWSDAEPIGSITLTA